MRGSSLLKVNTKDIYLVNCDPQIGNEIAKIRPVVVIDENIFDKMQSRIIVPITSWQDKFKHIAWYLKANNYVAFGLDNESAFDCRQVKNFSYDRFLKKIGQIDEETLFEIHKTIVKVLNFKYKISL